MCGVPLILTRDKINTQKFIVDFGFTNGGKQEAQCVNTYALKEYLKIRKHKGMTDLQIKHWNNLIKYLELDYLIIENYKNDSYIVNSINQYPKAVKFKCTQCNRELPLNKSFFRPDRNNKNSYQNVCLLCKFGKYSTKDKIGDFAYKNFKLKGYKTYKDNIYDFYYKYVFLNKDQFDINTKTHCGIDELDLVLYCLKQEYLNNRLNIYDFNVEKLIDEYNIKLTIVHRLAYNLIIEYICSDCKLKPYKYKQYKNKICDLNRAKEIFKNYIEDNNIVIENILEYNNYYDLICKSKIISFLSNVAKISLLEFIVKFYNNRFPGYKFKLASNNYYKNNENLVFDIKWFIEKDIKIDNLDKIPLYITKYSLNQKCKPVYNYLYNGTKIRNKSIFEVVNECYPDRFSVNDFEINPYRSKFDSTEECVVDDQLKKYFKNVIYNQRNTELEIKIFGMIPDWIIISEKGCILVEYFGMYTTSKRTKTSHRLRRYKSKTDIKLIKYNNVRELGYKTLLIFPEDILDNFEGLKNKIEKLL